MFCKYGTYIRIKTLTFKALTFKAFASNVLTSEALMPLRAIKRFVNIHESTNYFNNNNNK